MASTGVTVSKTWRHAPRLPASAPTVISAATTGSSEIASAIHSARRRSARCSARLAITRLASTSPSARAPARSSLARCCDRSAGSGAGAGAGLLLSRSSSLRSSSGGTGASGQVVEHRAEVVVGRGQRAHVDVRGVAGNAKVTAYEASRRKQVERVLRLDPLGIRNVLPQPVVRWAFARLAAVVRVLVARDRKESAAIEPGDFFEQASVDGVLDLLAICRR